VNIQQQDNTIKHCCRHRSGAPAHKGSHQQPEEQPIMAQREGTRLGNYDLLERIGTGGMAEVYRARQRNAFGRDVAIKIIRRSLAEDRLFRERFLREGQAAARLTHPHILPLIEVGEEGDTLFLAMAYVEGGTLRDLLARTRGALPMPMVAGFFSQLCEAVQYAHERGLVHRDIKPSNILLYSERNVLLADFGIALDTQEARLTSSSLALGTAEYMAPEQARGIVDTRSDLYSLGIVLFEMLSGRVPFTGRTAFDVLLQHANAPIPSLRTVLPTSPDDLTRLDDCLQRALAKDPEQRFQSATALNEAFQYALNGSATPVPISATLRPLRLQPAPTAQNIWTGPMPDTLEDQGVPLSAERAAQGTSPVAPPTFRPPGYEERGDSAFADSDFADEESDLAGERPTLANAPLTWQGRFTGGYSPAARSRRDQTRLFVLLIFLLLSLLGIGTFAFANAFFNSAGSQQASTASPSTRITPTPQQTLAPSPTLVPSPTPLPSPTATPLSAQLSVTPDSLTFLINRTTCSSTPSKTLTIQNSGSGTLNWQATITGKYLTISSKSGKVGGNKASSVRVSASCAHIAPQIVHDQILFTSNGGNTTVQVTITII
jgi:serine/threonine protein kinase